MKSSASILSTIVLASSSTMELAPKNDALTSGHKPCRMLPDCCFLRMVQTASSRIAIVNPCSLRSFRYRYIYPQMTTNKNKKQKPSWLLLLIYPYIHLTFSTSTRPEKKVAPSPISATRSGVSAFTIDLPVSPSAHRPWHNTTPGRTSSPTTA
jgi:hypothetical protein